MLRTSFFVILFCATLVSRGVAQVTFRDITRQAGINFVHNNGATGKKLLPETMGAGAAFIDYDNDGYPDILLVNGKDWTTPGKPSTLKLYHNNGNGMFTDVTAKSGLAISLFGMGAAVGDYDNDGFDDVYVSALGQSHLFHNNGNGTFSDVTKAAGMLGPSEFSTSAAWVDYDRDGKLDLIVVNYVQWSPQGDIYCTLDGTHKSYCTPESYKGASVRLWHNLGNGKFEDATAKAGLFDNSSKSLGVAVLDVNGDGWPDLVIANDTQPNKLYVNNTKGGFTESAVSAGIAFSEDGVARAGMGVDAADYDHTGRPSIVIGNFANQMLALYHNEGNGLFVDEAPRSEVGRRSLTLGFATLFFDYDNDGWLDIFVANGHIENEIERIQKRVKYAESPHLFHNQGKGTFVEATQSVGPDLGAPRVGRGAAYADIDNDGDLDLLMTTNAGPPVLFRNDGGNANHSLRIKLVGGRSNRDGIGTVAVVKAGGDRQTAMLRSGSGYLSSSELVLTFGLGKAAQADEIELRWPSGQVDKLSKIAAGQTLTVKEGSGIVQQRPFGAAAQPSAPAARQRKATR